MEPVTKHPAGDESDPTRRFSDKVENYVRYRPGYPPEALAIIRDEAGLHPQAVIADIGSGTGLSSLLFLENGYVVHGVEPNQPMRAAAEALLASYANFHSIAGTAEATSLPSRSVDLIVAGQAFHWFDPIAARGEFLRILRPGGWAALMWNTRRSDAVTFMSGYEALLQEFGTDYRQVRHENVDPSRLRQFFCGPYIRRTAPNEQRFDMEGLRGRLLSSSYIPGPGDARYLAMLQALERLFDEHAESGRVRFVYETEIYLARLA
jgi:SAM-dependent methyltransferase